MAYSKEADIERELLAAVDASTRLIAVSSVQFTNGLRLNLAEIGQICQQHSILFAMDAIQSLVQ